MATHETLRARAVAECVVAIRRQWEAEKTRLIVLAALGGGTGAGTIDAALDGQWVAVVLGAVLTLAIGAVWEWRWSVATRSPGGGAT